MTKLYLGKMEEVLWLLSDNSVDAIVTDPPYGLSFMGKQWDYDVPNVEQWREVFRVLKPGGHLLSFGGTRTYHRMVCAIEDAGFEVRDQVMWIYGSGFPKSLDVSKAIDKAAGAKRKVIGSKNKTQSYGDENNNAVFGSGPDKGGVQLITAPATDAAKLWQGWGTALKPANEPIVLARKPLSEKTVAKNVLKWGTGALNVDASRIEAKPRKTGTKGHSDNASGSGVSLVGSSLTRQQEYDQKDQGRWPANVLFDEEAAAVLDGQSGVLKGLGQHKQKATSIYGGKSEKSKSENLDRSEKGGASKFFYVAKSSKRERNAGLEGMPDIEKRSAGGTTSSGKPTMEGRDRFGSITKNHHPTVKPIKLMEYLVRMITPHGGTVLDPFMGSGSTGCAAKNLKRKFVGVEMNKEYLAIAQRRIEKAGT